MLLRILISTLQTWVVSGQSTDQQKLIEGLKKGTALYVEGAFRVWLRENQVFILTRVSAAFGRQNPSWIVGW